MTWRTTARIGTALGILVVTVALAINAPAMWRTLKLLYLVPRLDGDWELEDSWKAYWIGYTADMKAIAKCGESAIPPLLGLAESTDSQHTRYGAALAIHLTGIEGEVVGRTVEAFKSKEAREALLSLLVHEDLQPTLLELLIRDPWPSDVPHLLAHLKTQTQHSWAFVKALQRYHVLSRPVHQDLPAELADTPPGNVYFKNTQDRFMDAMYALWLLAERGSDVQLTFLERPLQEKSERSAGSRRWGFGEHLEDLTGSNYCHLGERLEYFLEGGNIVLCTMETARKRWLDFHEAQGSHLVVGTGDDFAHACVYRGLERLQVRYEWNPSVLAYSDSDGDTPLHQAAEYGHADVVRWLLEMGLEADSANREGKTPRMLARERKDSGAVEVLREFGARP